MSVTISDLDRRRRLAARHHLGRTASDAMGMVQSVAALHSTDPVTPYLACWARVPGFQVADLERTFYDERSVRRMHTIRRTLFVVPVDDAPWFEAGGAREVAVKERERLVGWLTADMNPVKIGPFLTSLADEVVDLLGDSEMSTKDLSARIPGLGSEVTVGQGKWSARVPLSTRLLFILAMEGRLVRTRPAGSWRSSQYKWATVEAWEGRTPSRPVVDEGRAEILRRYVSTHGPVTMTDLRWWTGWTVRAVNEALRAVGTITVQLESGESAFVLPGDTDSVAPPETSATFLPGLDSTPMGWKDRTWYLGGHDPQIFDRNGNAGPTVWLDGRVVGGWGQRPDGEVVYELLEPVESRAIDLMNAEANSLTSWLDGVVIMPRFPSPMSRRLSG